MLIWITTVFAVAVVAVTAGVLNMRRTRFIARAKWNTRDCQHLHRIGAGEMTIYGQIVSPEVLEHTLTCSRYTIAPDRKSGWMVVAKPVGNLTYIEYLCEHVWINPGGMSSAFCKKCGVNEASAYRHPTIIQGPHRTSGGPSS